MPVDTSILGGDNMKTLVVVLLACLVATSALGYPYYGNDTIGVFFDTSSGLEQIAIGPYVPFNVYLVLLYPNAPTNGFECTFTAWGPAPAFALSTTLMGNGPIDVDASVDGFMVGCASDYPVVNGGCVLAHRQYMLTGVGFLYFYVNKATIPSLPGGLPVVTGNGVLRRCGVSSGDVTFPCACVNYECRGLPVEPATFGAVKSLFR